MRGFETHKGYEMRLVFNAASNAFKWQRIPLQPFSNPAPQSQHPQTQQVGE